MGKIALVLKKIISSSGRRFFQMNNLFYRKNLLSEKLPEEGSFGRTNCSSRRTFFRKNKLFYRKNLLLETFRKNLLPEEQQFVLPEKSYSGRTQIVLPETFRKNLLPEEEIIFFNARTILPIHLIAGCTNNIAGCT